MARRRQAASQEHQEQEPQVADVIVDGDAIEETIHLSRVQTVGKLMDIVVATFKDTMKMAGWDHLTQQQREMVLSHLHTRFDGTIAESVRTIQAQGRPSAITTIDGVSRAAGVKITLRMRQDAEARHEIFDGVGGPALLVLLDPVEHGEQDEAKAKKVDEEPGLPLNEPPI